MKQESYRRIVSGSDQSTKAGMLRVVLRAASVLYALVVCIRNRLYDWGVLRSVSVEVPVVCIGNITAGGTGKTPLVIWLCKHLASKGVKCAILTRGYKTNARRMTDEPALLAKACGEVPVIVNSDRVAGALKAIVHYQPELIILDDGFQHRRLKRRLDIVAIDATCPFGYGRILPAGLLRESPKALKRAAAVVITRTNQADPQQVAAVEQQIRDIAPNVPIAKTVHKLKHAQTLKKETIALDELVGQPVFAFCGIGNPAAFFSSLEQNRLDLVGTRIFDDHHAYTQEDINVVFEKARRFGAKIVLCTQKDWVKSALLAPKADDIVFASLVMELDFLEGFDKISGLLDPLTKR